MLLIYTVIFFLNLLQSRLLHANTCEPGYHGEHCNMTCRYPNYGEECQLECLCEEEQCDHFAGCVWKNDTNLKPRLSTNMTKFKIMYVSIENNTFGTKPLYTGSMWSKMNMTRKAMLISSCIFGAILFVFMINILTCIMHKRKNAVVRYYWRRKEKTSQNYNLMIFDSKTEISK